MSATSRLPVPVRNIDFAQWPPCIKVDFRIRQRLWSGLLHVGLVTRPPRKQTARVDSVVTVSKSLVVSRPKCRAPPQMVRALPVVASEKLVVLLWPPRNIEPCRAMPFLAIMSTGDVRKATVL